MKAESRIGPQRLGPRGDPSDRALEDGVIAPQVVRPADRRNQPNGTDQGGHRQPDDAPGNGPVRPLGDGVVGGSGLGGDGGRHGVASSVWTDTMVKQPSRVADPTNTTVKALPR